MCGGSMQVLLPLICTSLIKGLCAHCWSWLMVPRSGPAGFICGDKNEPYQSSLRHSLQHVCLIEPGGTQCLCWGSPVFFPSEYRQNAGFKQINSKVLHWRLPMTPCHFLDKSYNATWLIFSNVSCQNMSDVTMPIHSKDVHLWNHNNPPCVTQLNDPAVPVRGYKKDFSICSLNNL